MSPLVYSLAPSGGQKHAELIETAGIEVSEDHWQQLARHITQEESLKHYAAEVLRARWLENRAAIIIHNHKIISYISVVAVFVDESRHNLAQALNLPTAQLPAINLYESATGWTHPQWRRKGLSLQLRRCLLAHFAGANRLIVSVSTGLAASPVLANLHWRLVAWNDIPFAASLIGVSTAGLPHPVTVQGRHLPEGMALYQGRHLDPSENTTHPWANFCYLWVSDELLAQKLDRELAALLNCDLSRWKEAVLAVLFTSPPERVWRPFLFADREK